MYLNTLSRLGWFNIKVELSSEPHRIVLKHEQKDQGIPSIGYGLQTFNTLMCIKRKQRTIINTISALMGIQSLGAEAFTVHNNITKVKER